MTIVFYLNKTDEVNEKKKCCNFLQKQNEYILSSSTFL